jgi:hypothetical protein
MPKRNALQLLLLITMRFPVLVIMSCKKGKKNPDAYNGSST